MQAPLEYCIFQMKDTEEPNEEEDEEGNLKIDESAGPSAEKFILIS